MRKLYEFESLSKLEVGIVISEERILIVLVWNMVTNKIFYKKLLALPSILSIWDKNVHLVYCSLGEN